MATEIDFFSVFDAVLPNVYIKKITLLPGSLSESGSDAEYDSAAPDRLETDKFGKKKVNESSVNFSNVNNNANGMIVNIEMVLKDRYDVNGKTFWFERDNILENMNLRVVLVNDKQLSRDLLARNFTPEYLQSNQHKYTENIISLKRIVNSTLAQQQSVTTDNQPTYDVNYTTSFFVPNSDPQTLTVFAHVFQDFIPVLQDRNVVRNSNRNRYFQGNTTVQRIFTDSQIVKDAFIFTLPNEKLWAGPVHNHPERGFMGGAFHTSEEHPTLSLRNVGNFTIEDHRLLFQDIAILGGLSGQELALVPFEQESGPRGFVNSSEKINIQRKESYITEPEVSVKPDNTVHFLFHVNYQKLIKENLQFGTLMDVADPNARFEMLQNSRIKNLSVFRERVINGLKKDDTKRADFSNDRTELIANSSEQTVGFLAKNTTERSIQNNSIKSQKVRVGSIREINLSANANSGVRTFGVTDYDMSRETNGLFRYYVEIEIEDGTLTFARRQLGKLRNAKKGFVEYYTEASNPVNLIPQTDKFNSNFILNKRQQYPIPSEQDLVNNNRTQRNTIVRESIASAPWIKAIATYLDVLLNLSANKGTVDLERISRLLYTLVSPQTGYLAGVEILLSLIETLESLIESKISGNKEIYQTNMNTRSKSSNSKAPRGTFRISKTFKLSHDSATPRNVGYDFLEDSSTQAEDTIGPKIFTAEQYESRITKENSKYVTQGTKFGESVQLDYSHLTPAIVHTGTNQKFNIIEQESGLYSKVLYDTTVSKIIQSKPQANLPVKSISTKESVIANPMINVTTANKQNIMDILSEVYEANINNSQILASLNITVDLKKEYEQKKKREDIKEDKRTTSRKVLGKNISLSTEAIEKEELSISEDLKLTSIEEKADLTVISSPLIRAITESDGGLFKTKNKKKKKRKIEDISISREDNIIDKHFKGQTNSKEKKKAYLNSLPVQVKTLVYGEEVQSRKNWFDEKGETGKDVLQNPEFFGLTYLLYNHINTVQVFTGFKKDSRGNPRISSPIFREMTEALFKRIKNNNLTVMCKMTPYNDSVLDFKKSKKMELPEFDSVFILSPRKKNTNALPVGTPNTVFESRDELNSAIQRQNVAATRLTEQAVLNSSGKLVMQQLTTLLNQANEAQNEYVRTAVLLEPRSIVRVGTAFTSFSQRDVSTQIPSSAVSSFQGSLDTNRVIVPGTFDVDENEISYSQNISPTRGNGGDRGGGY